MKNLTTVILAAGKSSRFKHNKSKIFHDLGGISIIEHIHNLAKKVSKNKIVFVCNDENINDLKKKFTSCKFVIQTNQNGTVGAVLSAKKFLKNTNVLILFGDVPLISLKSIKKLINCFEKNKSGGSLIAFKTNNPKGYGRVKTQGKYVTSIVEEINTNIEEKNINLCNSGVMICNSGILFNNLIKVSINKVKKEKFLPDIVNILYKINKSFTYIVASENEMHGVNTIYDFIRIDKIYQNILKNNIIDKGVIIYQPETVRLSFDTKIEKGTTIESFVTIKPGVQIKKNVLVKSYSYIEKSQISENSSIGPFARIRPNTKIGKNVKIGNYVEIKNSTIGDFSSINHLSYIGDSLVGKRVNVGAGTITCNYDGSKKNKTIIEDNAFIGSNSSLVAPLKISKNSMIGAGSVINQSVPKNSLALERSKIKILKKPRKK